MPKKQGFTGWPSQRQSFLFLFVCVSFLLFFRPGIALRLLGSFDERCYMGWIYWLVGTASDGCEGKSHWGGIALLWLPFGLVGALIASAYQESTEAWIVMLVGLSSFLYWAVSLFLIEQILDHYRAKSSNRLLQRFYLSPLLLLNIPVLYYATTRPLLVHAPECMLALLSVLMLLKKRLMYFFLCATLLTLTRLNDAPIFLMALGYTLDQKKRVQSEFRYGLAFCIAVFFGAVFYIGTVRGYNGVSLVQLLQSFTLSRFLQFFLRSDWGVVWTQPWWFFSLCLGTYWAVRQPKAEWIMGAYAWILFEFLICILWGTHGSSYGFRYLIGSYAAALVLCLEWWKASPRDLNRPILGVLCIGSFWNTLLNWIYPTLEWPWPKPNYEGLIPPYAHLWTLVTHANKVAHLFAYSLMSDLLRFLGLQGKIQYTIAGKAVNYGFSGGQELLLGILGMGATIGALAFAARLAVRSK